MRLDKLTTTKTELALDALLDEDSTFYGDLFPHAVQWHGELYLEDGLHRALRAALQQRNVIHVRVLDLDALTPPRPRGRRPGSPTAPSAIPMALGAARAEQPAANRRWTSTLRTELQPALLLGHPRRLDPGAGAGLADRRGQVVAHRPLRQEQPARRCRPRSRRPRRPAARRPPAPTAGWRPSASAAAARSRSMTRSPAITARMPRASSATGASLTRKPAAPTSIARRRKPGRPKVVRMTARQLGHAPWPARGRPRCRRRPGISMSSSATSGRCSRAAVDDGVPAADLGHDLEVVLQLEQGPQRPADQRLVLGDEHPDHRAATGPRPAPAAAAAASRKPPPAAGPGVQPPAERRRPARPARTARRRAGRPSPPRPVVGDGQHDLSSPSSVSSTVTVPRAAVPQHVRRRLPHHPAEHGVDRAGQRRLRASGSAQRDAGRGQRRPRLGQRLGAG